MSDDLTETKVSNIMSLLGHDLRIDILKLVFLAPRSFSDLLSHLSLESTSKLSFHLNKMNQLVVKRNMDGFYELTEIGLKAYNLVNEFDSDDVIKVHNKSKNGEIKNSGYTNNIRISNRDKNFTIPFLLLTLLLSISSLLIPWFLSLFVDRLIYTMWIFPIISQFIFLFVCYKLEIGFYDSIKIVILLLGIYWNIIIFFGTMGIIEVPIETIGLIIVIITIQIVLWVSIVVFFNYLEVNWPYSNKDKFPSKYLIMGSVSFILSIITYLIVIFNQNLVSYRFLIIQDSHQFYYGFSLNYPLSLLGGMFIPAVFAYAVFILIKDKISKSLKIMKYFLIIMFLTFVEFYIFYNSYKFYSNFGYDVDTSIIFLGTSIFAIIFFLNTLGIFLYLMEFNLIGKKYIDQDQNSIYKFEVRKEVFKMSFITISFFLTFFIMEFLFIKIIF